MDEIWNVIQKSLPAKWLQFKKVKHLEFHKYKLFVNRGLATCKIKVHKVTEWRIFQALHVTHWYRRLVAGVTWLTSISWNTVHALFTFHLHLQTKRFVICHYILRCYTSSHWTFNGSITLFIYTFEMFHYTHQFVIITLEILTSIQDKYQNWFSSFICNLYSFSLPTAVSARQPTFLSANTCFQHSLSLQSIYHKEISTKSHLYVLVKNF
jgi:hypothetical protein